MRHVHNDHLFGVVRRHVLDKVTDLCNRENGQNKLDSQTKCWEVGCERRQQKTLTELAEHYSLYHKVSTLRLFILSKQSVKFGVLHISCQKGIENVRFHENFVYKY